MKKFKVNHYFLQIVQCVSMGLLICLSSSCNSSNKKTTTKQLTPEEAKQLIERPNVITNVGKLPMMARPILLLFKAVKEKNPDILKDVFSTRIINIFKSNGNTWSEILDGYERSWKKKFGQWHLSEIYFDSTVWSPDKPDKGKVGVSFHPARLQEPLKSLVPVVKEGGKWYIDAK